MFGKERDRTSKLMSTISKSAIICMLGATMSAQAQDADGDNAEVTNNEDVVVVLATRTQKSAKAIPSTITLIGEDELEDQLAISSDLFSIVGNLVPSLSPSRQKISSQGESFRGRKPLYLIDGVPQSNPLRDGSRASYTIDPMMLERVEVIHGSNAIQGLGATGGIINYITRSPSDNGEFEQRVGAQITADDGFNGNGFGFKGFYSASQKIDDFDFLVAGSYHKRGIGYDGDGRAIGLAETQGDLMDSNQIDLFAKLGYEVTDTGKLSFMINRFHLKGTDDYIRVDGSHEDDITATTIKGTIEGDPATNKALTSSLSYNDSDVGGGILSLSAYYQDFSGLYGGGRYALFQDPTIAPIGELYEQSRNTSRKIGFRSTYVAQNIGNIGLDVTTGVDLLNDRTYQELYQTSRKWVPETNFYNVAPFVQLDQEIGDMLTVSGGVRLEYAKLKTDDYTTLAGNTRRNEVDPYIPVDVEGGEQSFTDALLNAGVVFNATDEVTLFASYSQGFTMPDVGRVLRAISVPGTSVAGLIDLQPVISDNLEFGASFDNDFISVKASYFISKSDLGSRLSPDEDGVFSVNREKTRIKGFELAASANVTEQIKIGGNYSNIEGHYDDDGDNVVDTTLPGVNISPDTLNLYIDVEITEKLSAKLQSNLFFDRSFDEHDTSTYDDF